MRKLITICAVLTMLLAVSGVAQATITIDMVTVGNAGNAGEQRRLASGDLTYYGGVAYEYKIGKYEVTAGQYTAFLNSVAATTDTYGLYNADMWISTRGCKIEQTVTDSGYSYSVGSDYANRPVNYVSWYDAIRFANWMTGGDTESGSYLIEGGGVNSGAVTIPNATQRAAWAAAGEYHVLLTSEDEWYKAAYYTGSGYSDYANGMNTAPPKGADGWNYGDYQTGPWNVGSGAEEQNGTFDMMGNVWEWNEAIFGVAGRVTRGGSFDDLGTTLRSFYRTGFNPPNELSVFGFRVSEVPEPATVALLGLGALSLLRRRKA